MKIKQWLIRKLGGIPEDQLIQPPIIKKENIEVETIMSTVEMNCYEIYGSLVKEEYLKKLAVDRMSYELLKYTEFTVRRDPETSRKTLIAKLRVVRKD